MRRLLLGLALLCAACDPPDKGEIFVARADGGTRASLTSFREASVSMVIEKRCGSLDCHGTNGRNLRIYSMRGLRMPNDAGIVVGNGDTTAAEQIANYQSLLDLEPEETSAVLRGGDPNTLLIVKKPLAIESHKGGQVIRRGDDAERCIVSWLREDATTPVDRVACETAAIFPKE